MLDIHTLEETIKWLSKKAEETPSDGGKKKLLQKTVFELQQIQQQTVTAPQHIDENNHEILELVKDTKTQTVFKCKFCGVEQKVYKLYFSTVHAQIAAKIFKYCIENKTFIFNKKDLNLNHTEYGNFPFLKRFGLIYKEKPETGKTYGAPVRRLKEFLNGEWAVAEYSSRETKSKRQEVSETRVFISQIKRLKGEFIEELAPYFVEYEKQQ